MFKKSVAMLLVVLLMFSLFGCGNGNNEENNNNDNNTVVNDNNADNADNEENTNDNNNNAGDTNNNQANNTDNTNDNNEVSNNDNEVGNNDEEIDIEEEELKRTPKEIDVEKDTITILGIDQPQFNPEYEEEAVVYDFLLENYGVEIEQIVTSNAEFYTMAASLILSGESPDLVTAHQQFPQLALQDIIQPVDGILDFNDPSISHLEGAYELYNFEGEHFIIPWLIMAQDFIFYNKQTFVEAALEDPEELYDRGEWDWNAFRDAALELTYDSTGDGTIDKVGVGFCGWHESLFVHSTGVTLANMTADGNINSNLRDPSLARAFNFLVDLINEDGAGMLADSSVLSNGTAAMYQGPFFWAAHFDDMRHEKNLGRVPIPKDPMADDYYQSAAVIGYYMPKGSDSPRTIEAFTHSAVIAMMPALEGTEKYRENMDRALEDWPEWTEEELNAWNERGDRYNNEITPAFDIVQMPGVVDIQAIFTRMNGDGLDYSTVVEELEPQFEAFLEDVLAAGEVGIDDVADEMEDTEE